MGIRFKKDKLPNDPEKRLAYLYNLQEKLRLFHNHKASQIKTGKITIVQFRKFQYGWFKKRNSLICGEILNCKNKLTKEEKDKLLEIDEVDKTHGAVKDKEKYKKDTSIKNDISDMEEY